MQRDTQKTRIVIVGGGFAGAYCAQALEKKISSRDTEVLLLDRNNYFVFSPLLIEAGVGEVEPRHAVVSIRSFLRKTEFRMAEVDRVDPSAQQVHYRLSGGTEPRVLDYDHLVIATGSVPRLPDVPGLLKYAHPLKSLVDAVALRDHILQLLEWAEGVEDPEERKSYCIWSSSAQTTRGWKRPASFWRLCGGWPVNLRTSRLKIAGPHFLNFRIAFFRRSMNGWPTTRRAKLRDMERRFGSKKRLRRLKPTTASLSPARGSTRRPSSGAPGSLHRHSLLRASCQPAREDTSTVLPIFASADTRIFGRSATVPSTRMMQDTPIHRPRNMRCGWEPIWRRI